MMTTQRIPNVLRRLFPRTERRALKLPKGHQLYAALDLTASARSGGAPRVLSIIAAPNRQRAVEVFLVSGPVQHLVLEGQGEDARSADAIKRELIGMLDDETAYAVVALGRHVVAALA